MVGPRLFPLYCLAPLGCRPYLCVLDCSACHLHCGQKGGGRRAAPPLCEPVLLLFCTHSLATPGGGGLSSTAISRAAMCPAKHSVAESEGKTDTGSAGSLCLSRFSAIDQRFVVCLDNYPLFG